MICHNPYLWASPKLLLAPSPQGVYPLLGSWSLFGVTFMVYGLHIQTRYLDWRNFVGSFWLRIFCPRKTLIGSFWVSGKASIKTAAATQSTNEADFTINFSWTWTFVAFFISRLISQFIPRISNYFFSCKIQNIPIFSPGHHIQVISRISVYLEVL